MNLTLMTSHDLKSPSYPLNWGVAMRSEIDPGISRVTAALSLLGQPQVALRGRCLHVAGTNGKGSVCAMLYAVCRPWKQLK